MERRGTGKVGTETEDKHGDGLEGLWIAAAAGGRRRGKTAAAGEGRHGENVVEKGQQAVREGGRPKTSWKKGHPGRTIRLREVVGGESCRAEDVETARQTEVRATVEPENSGEGPPLACLLYTSPSPRD